MIELKVVHLLRLLPYKFHHVVEVQLHPATTWPTNQVFNIIAKFLINVVVNSVSYHTFIKTLA